MISLGITCEEEKWSEIANPLKLFNNNKVNTMDPSHE
jgi:hypothetical protein